MHISTKWEKKNLMEMSIYIKKSQSCKLSYNMIKHYQIIGKNHLEEE